MPDLMPLSGVRVAEIGTSVAAAAAGARLRDLGAAVTRYRPACQPAAAEPEAAEPAAAAGQLSPDGYLGQVRSGFLGKGKAAETAGPELEDLLAAASDADITLLDLAGTDIGPLLPDEQRYCKLVESLNHNVWLSISPFGFGGPLSGFLGCELTFAASGGPLRGTHPAGDQRPTGLPGAQASYAAAQVAVLAALHGLDTLRHDGAPVHLDVSVQESVLAATELLACTTELMHSSRGGSERTGPPRGLYPCVDGFVHILLFSDRQWLGLRRALGDPEWAAGIIAVPDRVAHAAQIDEALSAWTADQQKGDCARALQGFGVPAAPLNSPDDLRSDEGLRSRRFFDRSPYSVLYPPSPPIAVASPQQAQGSATPAGAGLRGLRVVECGHVLAVPYAAAILGAMGADVLRVDDTAHPDAYIANGPYVDTVPGPGRGCYFLAVNHSKQRTGFDVEADPDRLHALVDGADVLLENWGQSRFRRALARKGAPARRATLTVNSSGYGHTGANSSWRAYAYNIHAYAGATFLASERAGEPAELEGAWADLATGLEIAALVAAWAIGSRPAGSTVVDLSMSEIVASHFAEFITASDADLESADPDLHEYCATGHGRDAPHGTYRTEHGEAWVAVAVSGQAEWASLCQILDCPQMAKDPLFATGRDRLANREALDRAIVALLYPRQADDLVHRLQSSGIRACRAWSGAELAHNEQLASREMFPELNLPVVGRQRLVGIPWRFVNGGRPRPRWNGNHLGRAAPHSGETISPAAESGAPPASIRRR
jgi:crotonobetainyl-CoA:carnitine CoA-transferase CaiB-like acyl-CoA transferase